MLVVCAPTCLEPLQKTYKVSHFKSFAHFGFVDHNPPPLKLLVELIEDVVAYLAESKEHVAALHCKGAAQCLVGLVSCCF